jgi:restriction system protein
MASRWEQAGLPDWDTLLWVTLQTLREMSMPVTVDEVAVAVSDRLHLTDEQRAIPSHDPRKNLIRFQIGFVVSHLKGMGALDQPRRRYYSLTDDGRQITESEMLQRKRLHDERIRERRRLRKEREAKEAIPADGSSDDIPPGYEVDWQQELLDQLKNISPTAFEHLAAALLRSASFDDVEVTGRSSDGGIDGIGTYRPSGLISFHTAFQCKRYQGSVGASTIRDFRGSFIGRADRGIIVTTGYFTRDARAEASRSGANPVDLIDGEALCDLLKEHQLGVRVTQRMVEDITIDDAYFERLNP